MIAARVASMKALSLFSGIGGLDLAAESCGIETAAFCEIEPYAVKVLERRFQGIENHGDITRFTNRTLRELGGSPFHRFKCPADYNGTIDIVHGGFPCQDLSVAGKQKGLSGERSGLWFEMLRVISEIRPAFVLAENVRGAINLALDTVQSGMEAEGYEVRTLLLPAAAFGAPHQRERLFVVGIREDVAHAINERLQGSERPEALRGEGSSAPKPAAECGEGGGKLCPTPCSRGDNGGGPIGLGGGARAKKKLDEHVGEDARKKLCSGSLNPAWVEILMGFPLGWTDLDCEEPEPWPGWPALMNCRGEDEVWPTPQASTGTNDLNWEATDVRGRPNKIGWGVRVNQNGQFDYEPPRTVTGCPNRAKRLKCLGNAVVPAQARPFFEAIRQIHNFITCECFT